MKFLFPAGLIVLSLPAAAAELTLTFAGAQSGGGPVMVAIYDEPEGFSGGGAKGAVVLAMVEPSIGGLSLQGLMPGRYAVKAYQDANRDRALNVDSTGRPTEAVAVSGRATGGWPRFDTAAIPIQDSTQVRLDFTRP